ncbi:MAG: septal ring lytic transglycosylase RlpA family protein [Chlorobiaceae bacterium]|nr:septal ring lytic transglycosylase RlpA family protein [Chlorobiaceae bacterium]NTV60264.1 septal ring lytic transglycosylase RlpA family protein [Chlorobiaceae bacterium]
MKYGKTIFTASLIAILISSGLTAGIAETPAPEQTDNRNIFSTISETAKKIGNLFSSPANLKTSGSPFLVTRGTASYYADQFQGRRTANGETFNMHELTAAHRSLPFGTWVKVTNMNNGKDVIVRINDRGPYVKGRIIDLSIGAAKELGIVHSGIVKVRLEAFRPES